MNGNTIILVGGPDSGKTNYLARVWESIRSKTGSLIAPLPPSDIEFVEEALEHLLKGKFAPRSDRNIAESTHSFAIAVRRADRPNDPVANIVVPDVTGELWKLALETYEIPQAWMDTLQSASGALLFVREGSKTNEPALDWVTCAPLLKHLAVFDAATSIGASDGAAPELTEKVAEAVDSEADPVDEGDHKTVIPTQVALCEYLRFLEFGLKREPGGAAPRVAVLVTAWDLLDKEKRAQGPMAYLRSEYPIFAGRLDDIATVEVKAFGVSVVSGDFEDPKFKEEFFRKKLKDSGYVVTDDEPAKTLPDLTLPLSWAMNI